MSETFYHGRTIAHRLTSGALAPFRRGDVLIASEGPIDRICLSLAGEMAAPIVTLALPGSDVLGRIVGIIPRLPDRVGVTDDDALASWIKERERLGAYPVVWHTAHGHCVVYEIIPATIATSEPVALPNAAALALYLIRTHRVIYSQSMETHPLASSSLRAATGCDRMSWIAFARWRLSDFIHWLKGYF